MQFITEGRFGLWVILAVVKQVAVGQAKIVAELVNEGADLIVSSEILPRLAARVSLRRHCPIARFPQFCSAPSHHLLPHTT